MASIATVRRTPDSLAAARSAGLRYVSDAEPGIRRRRSALGFHYVTADGRALRARHELRRIHALVIPPAWQDVWICAVPNGHIQATARDARGRKQYRYHPRWRDVRDDAKYGRLAAFAQALPRIRARTHRDLALPGLPRAKVLAAIVRLLASTLIRIGNESYARDNGSFGLTTLRDRHTEIVGGRIRFRFRGKSKKDHLVTIDDPRLAGVVRRCQELPGQTLFQYRDGEGACQVIVSDDVNAYLREVTGEGFTAKDFRTWAGTLLMATELSRVEPPTSSTAVKRAVVAAIETASQRLGNTRAVCRRCYVHPAVIAAFEDGTLRSQMTRRNGRTAGLLRHETALLGLLRRAALRAPSRPEGSRVGVRASS